MIFDLEGLAFGIVQVFSLERALFYIKQTNEGFLRGNLSDPDNKINYLFLFDVFNK